MYIDIPRPSSLPPDTDKEPPPPLSGSDGCEHHDTVRTLRSLKGWGSSTKHLANQLVIEVPVNSYKHVKKIKGVGSAHRETKHFSSTTTMHGPKRIFYGKGVARAFWVLIVGLALAMLIFQIVVLLQMYFSKPTLSQVSFIVNEGGMDFPAVTVCNFNPIKKSYVRELNASGDLTGATLEYLLQTNMDAMFVFSNLDRNNLKQTHDEAETYFQNHTDFQIIKFLRTAGYDCGEMFLTCYFGGRRFDCCKYMKQKVTSLGKCWELDLQNLAPEWMRKQISPGSESGLQMIVDAQLEEELRGEDGDANAIFSDIYENGFRYYIHPPGANAELTSEGISVSPSRTVYSAIKTISHNLLNRKNWGNCSEHWPERYDTFLSYSASACRALCIAQYFNDTCGCAPFTYNVDGKKKICAPYESITCMDNHMLRKLNGTDYLELPDCTECHMECQSTSYTSYNSYGDGFNRGSLEWLKKISNKTETHIKNNVAVINIFFLEMFYTSYSQVQATSLTEILSDIGGNMGMFLGMSVITITELTLFFSKIFWIMFSKRRRQYMYSKKAHEKEKEQQLDDAVKEFQERRSRRNSRENISALSNYSNRIVPLEEFQKKFAYKNGNSMDNLSSNSLDSVIELKFDINELRRQLNQQSSDGIARIRLPTQTTRPNSTNMDNYSSGPPIFTIEPLSRKSSQTPSPPIRGPFYQSSK
ncbi:hypothetical protein GCK72_002242 [Caenorhabditis remanei]|uniref:Uncharacterized protein n=1 Tax=Caenorhabditis remanei TaxID=31234 RepID=A0A6A5HUT2_CAERE|nr:hypothetical protein GCK72_002242 [Caenorhabditis remanei]KAF1770424.1 hypothetical protein GCK72_002242 [Caenorhabditis remanei]